MGIEIKKTLTPVVVGEKLGEAGDATEAPEVLVPSDIDLVRGRIIMDYGDSGDGKSTRAHSFARYYYAKTGLPVVLVSAEDSSKTVFQDLIDAGVVVPIFLISSTTPLSTYERIIEGDLPVPGQFDVIKKTVKKDGKEVVEEVKKQKWTTKEENHGKYGAYIFEGVSTIVENVLDYFRETGRFPREQNDGYSEGGKTFMAASQTAFGVAQGEGLKLVRNSAMLPVERILWTSHESKGKDDDGNLIRGPKLVGSAATNTMRKLVGILLHTERVDGQIRVYFENHADQFSPKVSWKAKVTVNPFFATELKKKFPGGFFVPKLPDGQDYLTSEDGLIPFLKMEEEVRSKGSLGANAFAAAVQSKLKQTKEN
jgi:hypothetical protein